MAWQDRIKEAALRTPSGSRLLFQYADVRLTFDLQGTAYNFVDAEGTYIQGTGRTGDTFPLRIFIAGDDYDQAATTFLDGISEPGFFILEHPLYGVRNVVPLGRVTRRDDLVTAANQAIFDVAFWETIATLYPTGQTDPASEVLAAVADYNTASATEYEEQIDLDSQIETVTLENRVAATTALVSSSLATVSEATEAVSDQFTDILDSINNSIDILVGDPLTLAFQVNQLIQSPGRAAALWDDKLTAYRNLADQITGQDTATPGNDSRPDNDFFTDSVTATGALTGAIVGAVNNTFATRPEALAAAQNILALADQVNTWREENYESLGQTDTGGGYQQWQDAAALAAGFLVEISFTLAQERVITLDSARTIVDLAAELYGEIDAKLDFLIDSNDLSGNEMREIPAGRVIKYYV